LYLEDGGRQDVESDQLLVPDHWYHVAATYDGVEQVLYIDGTMIAARLATGLVVSNDFFEIGTGARLTGDRDVFEGLIDEVRVWNVARAAEQIRAGVARELAGDEAGLLAYWQLNDGEGQVALDGTGNSFDATLGSTPEADGNDPAWSDLGFPFGDLKVAGSIRGVLTRVAVCTNRTTGQSVVIRLQGRPDWNCENSGLDIRPGDDVRVVLTGTAR
jgi:hypothetical protein